MQINLKFFCSALSATIPIFLTVLALWQRALNLLQETWVFYSILIFVLRLISRKLQSCFMHLRNIARIRPFLSFNDLNKVVNALVSSRLDYCNALYTGLSQSCLHRLQLVQNAAARLITGTRRFEHITPVLASRHWLPVKLRIDFKIVLLTFKALHGLAPSYITELFLYKPAGNLRSSNLSLLVVPRSRLVTKGDRAFAIYAPKLWKDLPEDIQSASSLMNFKSLLKTYFYKKAF